MSVITAITGLITSVAGLIGSITAFIALRNSGRQSTNGQPESEAGRETGGG